MRIIYKLFLMVFVLSICSIVFAVEGEEKTTVQTKDETKLEEIVVTATRTEKDIESAPGDVHVVTKKDIEKRNIKTIDESLNTTPEYSTAAARDLWIRLRIYLFGAFLARTGP